MSEGHLSSYLYLILSQKSYLLKLYFLALEKQKELRDSNLFLKLAHADFMHWLSTCQMKPGNKDKISGLCSDLYIRKHFDCIWWQAVVNYPQACHSQQWSEMQKLQKWGAGSFQTACKFSSAVVRSDLLLGIIRPCSWFHTTFKG